MKGSHEALLWVAALAAAYAVIILMTNTILGRPPLHCRYFVAVKSKPGVYSCSEYPRVVETVRR